MSLTLGEKLRQAREEKGFTISEVAEQTRISSLYLQSIENDDYNTLPGGIFNKGFVKSFAKFVGVNEQEALDDYGRLISQTQGVETDDLKVFRPEVLTDDRSGASMAPTIIIAAIILALMTVGILFLVDYLRKPAAEVAANVSNANTALEAPAETPHSELVSNAPKMDSLKVEFTALTEPVALLVTSDGKTNSTIVSPGTSVLFEPKEALKLSYSRSLANVVQLTINGKKIVLPAQPLLPRRNAIDFEINKENLERIWTSGSISSEVTGAEAVSNINAMASNTDVQLTPNPVRPVSTPGTRLAPAANANTTRPQPASSGTPRPVSTPASGANPATKPDQR
jgi:cytoskeleton protein RodZ